MKTPYELKNNQVKRKLERLKKRLEKYPNQVTKQEKQFLARALAVKEYIQKKQGEKDERNIK